MISIRFPLSFLFLAALPLCLAAASPKFELPNTNAIPTETTCSSLVIANGHVLLRTHDALWSFGNTL